MANFLLDTNILSALEDPRSVRFEQLYQRLSACSAEDDISISIISVYEYQYGIANASEPLAKRLKESMRDFEELFTVIPLSLQGAEIFGRLKSAHIHTSLLPDKAAQRLTADMMIASSAIEIDAVLVSNDQIFSRIAEHFPALKVDDWTQ